MLASWLCFRYLTTLMKWTTLEIREITGDRDFVKGVQKDLLENSTAM